MKAQRLSNLKENAQFRLVEDAVISFTTPNNTTTCRKFEPTEKVFKVVRKNRNSVTVRPVNSSSKNALKQFRIVFNTSSTGATTSWRGRNSKIVLV